MATANYIQQPAGVGISRCLTVNEKEHVVCLLRMIERLPIITATPSTDPEILRRQFTALHENLVTLAGLATEILSDETPTAAAQ